MLKIIELFAGIGSQTQALKNIGIPHDVVAISDNDKYADKSYRALHGEVNNLGDIRQIQELPSAELWTYSFPCFTGETLILTDEGYKQIKDLTIGENVITHNNQYRKVTDVENMGEKATVRIKAMPFDALQCTANHRFYTREMFRRYPAKKPRQKLRLFHEPQWAEAKDLTRKHYLGYAINTKSTVPTWGGALIKTPYGRSEKLSNKLSSLMGNKDFWWMVGRFIGDGWTRYDGTGRLYPPPKVFLPPRKINHLMTSARNTQFGISARIICPNNTGIIRMIILFTIWTETVTRK
jgi:hypothetical protein